MEGPKSDKATLESWNLVTKNQGWDQDPCCHSLEIFGQ